MSTNTNALDNVSGQIADLKAQFGIPDSPKRETPKKSAPQKAAPVSGTAPNGAKLNGDAAYKALVEWTHVLILELRKREGNKYKGVHSVFSNFNLLLGAHCGLIPDEYPSMSRDAREPIHTAIRRLTDAMVERGDLQMRPAKKGPMFYIPGDLGEGQRKTINPNEVLKAMGL